MMRKEKKSYIYTTCDLNPGPYVSGHVLLTTTLLGAWTKSSCRYSTWNLDKIVHADILLGAWTKGHVQILAQNIPFH